MRERIARLCWAIVELAGSRGSIGELTPAQVEEARVLVAEAERLGDLPPGAREALDSVIANWNSETVVVKGLMRWLRATLVELENRG